MMAFMPLYVNLGAVALGTQNGGVRLLLLSKNATSAKRSIVGNFIGILRKRDTLNFCSNRGMKAVIKFINVKKKPEP